MLDYRWFSLPNNITKQINYSINLNISVKHNDHAKQLFLKGERDNISITADNYKIKYKSRGNEYFINKTQVKKKHNLVIENISKIDFRLAAF